VDIRLDGKVALVTGASKDRLRSIEAPGRSGGVGDVGLLEVKDALKEQRLQSGDEFHGHIGTPRTLATGSVEACVTATVERLGKIDILVNNAATNPHFGPLLELDQARAPRPSMSTNSGALLVPVCGPGRSGHGGGQS